MQVYRSDTEPTQRGNYNLAVTCSAGHVTYKKDGSGASDPYKCGQVTNPANGTKCGLAV